MCSEPLNDYFKMGGKKPDFALRHTACWRSYEGTWEISDGKLYLIHLSGTTKAGDAVNLETVFCGSRKQVFAHWYSGKLRLPQGNLLEYVHAGYATIYERDFFLEIDRGVVSRTFNQTNVAPRKKMPGILGRLWSALNSGY